MHLVRYSAAGHGVKFGIESGGLVTDLTSFYEGFAEMVADIPNLRRTEPAAVRGKVDSSALLPPVDRRSKVLCMALNYFSHIKETGADATEEPILFPKYYASLTGPYAQIPFTKLSPILDYEGEIAVVIGATARNVGRSSAWDHVAGYTVLNDVSARSLFRVKQGDHTMLDWFSCKNMDASTPVGPWIATADEVGDFAKLRVETALNGVGVQSASVSDMVFDVPEIIEFASSRTTLEPGDVISTGTPAGVGVTRKRTLMKNDTIKVEVPGIGSVENRVV